MGDFNMFWGTLITGLLMYWIISYVVRIPGKFLRHRFVAMGDMRGLSKERIIAAVGKPSAVSVVEYGSVLQWCANGYSVALLFDEQDNCVCITDEACA